ncbi:MAG TPA: hypothetical protein PK239_18635 [Chitinophagales bacterium]|nr:hypothetical protein [Chitinophagales bacterium]
MKKVFVVLFFLCASLVAFSQNSNEIGLIFRNGLSKAKADPAPYATFEAGLQYKRLLSKKIFVGTGLLYAERYHVKQQTGIQESFLVLPLTIQYKAVAPNQRADITLFLGTEYSALVFQQQVHTTLPNDGWKSSVYEYSKLGTTMGMEAGYLLTEKLRLGLGFHCTNDSRIFSGNAHNQAAITKYRAFFTAFSLTQSF